MRRLVAIFLLSTIVVNAMITPEARAGGGLRCLRVFSPGASSKNGKEFSLEFFKAEKARFQKSTHEAGLTFRDRPETFLAWVEARSEQRGFDFIFSAEHSLDQNKQEKMMRLGQAWAETLLKKGRISGETSASGAKLQRMLAQLHHEMYAPGWRELPSSLNRRAELAVAERVQTEILSGELVEALRLKGEKVEPLHFERLGRRLYAAGGVSWAVTLALSAASPLWMSPAMPGAAFLPPLLPRTKLEYARELDPELVKQIKKTKNGYQVFEREAMRQLGADAKTGWVVDVAARILVIVCVVYFLEELFEYLPWATGFMKEAFRAEFEFREAHRQLGADAVREQLMVGWRQWFQTNQLREPSAIEVGEAESRFKAIPDARLLGRSDTPPGV